MKIKVLASSSKGNCYYISDGQTSLLLDAGIPIKQIQVGIGFRLRDISGVLITHRHNDHSKAILDLIKAGVDVYALDDVFKAKGISGHRCHSILPLKPFTVGSMSIMPFDCVHDVPNSGYLISSNYNSEKLLYFTDTHYVKYTFQGLNYILAECNFSKEAIDKSIADGRIPHSLKKRLINTHMSIDVLLDMLRANDLSAIRQIYLLHLSDNNGREDEFKAAVQKATGCEVYIC
jgi:phosphoribosyl 1,2-cyclic phosphodiesterase